MTLPLLLCNLIALTSGLHFGLRFIQARRAGQSLVPSVVAHAVITTPLVILTFLLDPTDQGRLWTATALIGAASLALGALWPSRAPVRAEAPAARDQAEVHQTA